jgi:hypothetical protein
VPTRGRVARWSLGSNLEQHPKRFCRPIGNPRALDAIALLQELGSGPVAYRLVPFAHVCETLAKYHRFFDIPRGSMAKTLNLAWGLGLTWLRSMNKP